ncbi:MAG: cyclase family protein [Planctomycetaceae bacterium]|nr:cyclase family protein [Planctomycetaceae bacterium]
MKTRTLVLLAVVGSLLVVAFGRSRAAEPDQAAKPTLTRSDIDGMMKSLSNWGRWGQDDELGTLNLITPDKRKKAAALVQEGVSVSLARNVIKTEKASSPEFGHKMTGLPQQMDITSASDEYRVAYHGFTQTHMDALCHLFYKGQMYNGFSQNEVTERGAAKLSVVNVKQGVFTRGVLMDMPKLLGVRFLEGKQAIYPSHLEAWEKAAGIKVASGDAVLIRTGRWARGKVEGEWDIMKNSAGLHASCLPWLKERDVAIVGSDLALDVLPSGVEGFELPVHWVVVVAMGMPILDNCDFEAVSEAADARKRWSFLLTVAPLAVEGGTGSPVNPLATF